MMHLADINCRSIETYLSIDLQDFNLKQFLKDYPPTDKSTLTEFKKGKTQFFWLFVPRSKSDFHVHYFQRIYSNKSQKKINIFMDFCKDGEHTKKRRKKVFSYYEDFFSWFKKYVNDFSKVSATTDVEYGYNAKKYKSIFRLPLSLNVSSKEMGFEGMNLSGFKLTFKDSQMGIDNIKIETYKELFKVFINDYSSNFDESYFDRAIQRTSQLAYFFIKEVKNENSV